MITELSACTTLCTAPVAMQDKFQPRRSSSDCGYIHAFCWALLTRPHMNRPGAPVATMPWRSTGQPIAAVCAAPQLT